MEIEERRTPAAVVLAPRGKFNLVTGPSVKARIDALVQSGLSRIVVDLSDVDFIDSSGLGALIGGLKSARQAGGDVRIAAAGEQVATVLRLTNLDRILVPHATADEALNGW